MRPLARINRALRSSLRLPHTLIGEDMKLSVSAAAWWLAGDQQLVIWAITALARHHTQRPAPPHPSRTGPLSASGTLPVSATCCTNQNRRRRDIRTKISQRCVEVGAWLRFLPTLVTMATNAADITHPGGYVLSENGDVLESDSFGGFKPALADVSVRLGFISSWSHRRGGSHAENRLLVLVLCPPCLIHTVK